MENDRRNARVYVSLILSDRSDIARIVEDAVVVALGNDSRIRGGEIEVNVEVDRFLVVPEGESNV